jgi:hypothetical protein
LPYGYPITPIGGYLVKFKKFVAAASFVLVLMLILATFTSIPARAQATSSAPAASATPQGWDASIPLPPGAVLLNSTVPKTGVVYAADFAVPGNYKELVDFYEKELPKAGFGMGPKVAMAARKVYNRSFSRGGNLDSVVITPIANDPSKMNIHFAWSSQTPKKPPS